MRVISFTGHRDLLGRERIVDNLVRHLLRMYEEKYGVFRAVTGGASGADARAAYAAIRLEVWHTIMLPHMAYPAHYGVDMTPQIGPRTVVGAISAADAFDWRMNFERNRAMLEAADDLAVISHHPIDHLLLATKGGTGACIKKAKQMGFDHIIHVDTANKDLRRYSLQEESYK